MSASRGQARFGVLVPFTNSNLEPDMALLRPDGVSLHFARMGGYDEDEIPDADQMHALGAADLDEPLRLLTGVKPDVVVYGCTSATLTHGPAFDRDLAARIAQASGAKTVTAAGALVAALTALEARKIAFASPYVPTINDMAIHFLGQMGFDTVHRADFEGTLDNEGQGALSPREVFALGQRADHLEAEVVVLSCTDMRSVEVLEDLEQALGKPVISSNQAMVFQAMCLLGLRAPITGFGQLLASERS
ncbi:Asp/Glu racemase [uncultured Tateyamaria sp.]|uniref:maleate cis-trans isomerase family protein n=1 Tax=uncultured Tateyamaria sp. TaxID=455651 RepID=UPI00261225BE|nr:Asp/Glu racemase [uncultured Tateyamaria sp.]